MSVLRILFILLEVVLIFNLMIIVHEVGHFLAARWRGLVVEKFGIWFGKPLWKKTINGVEYSLGSIPAGGFVALPQMAPMEVMEGKVDTPREALPPISALDKIIVAFAGPLFSVLLAFVFAGIVCLVGRPVAEAEKTTVVGYVDPDMPAAKAGILPGDKILKVDGNPVTRFGGMSESVSWYVIGSEGKTIPFEIERDHKVFTLESNFDKKARPFWERADFRQVGVYPAETPYIGEIMPGSPAEKAGLKVNDFVVGINGEKIYSPLAFDDYFGSHPSWDVVLDVERGKQTLKIPLRLNGLEVGDVTKNSPADTAGIQKGDLITALNGQPTFSQASFSKSVQKLEGQVLEVTYNRGAETRTVKLKPARPDSPKSYPKPIIGVAWKPDAIAGIIWDSTGKVQITHPSPVEQIKSAGSTLLLTLRAVTSRKSDIGLQHLSGPLGIMETYYRILSGKYGWQMALWFSVVLNINLAIMNMLPIPVLDGGHITLAIVEAIRRRPVETKILIWVQSACAYVIMGFLLYVTFFDSGSLLGFGKKGEVKFDRPVPAVTQ